MIESGLLIDNLKLTSYCRIIFTLLSFQHQKRYIQDRCLGKL